MSPDQRKLFRQVVSSNANTFANATQQAAELFAIQEGSRIRTDDEIRALAVAYFTEQLAERLTGMVTSARKSVGD